MSQAFTTSKKKLSRSALLGLSVLAGAAGCTPSYIVGPLSHVDEERDVLLARARAAGTSEQTINAFIPLQSTQEGAIAREQDASCRNSYMWKNGLTWTGSILIAAAAGFTIGSAFLASNKSTSNTGEIAFGVSAGTLATAGSGLVAIGGIIANGFIDRGCQSKITTRSGD